MRPSFAVRLVAALPLFPLPALAGPLAPIWAGAYAGIDGGYIAESFAIPGTREELSGAALFGGAHAGYNFQVGFLVAGIEADAMLADGMQKTIVSGFSVSADPTWIASVRARAGFTFANLLIYGTGGYAYLNGSVKARTAPYEPRLKIPEQMVTVALRFSGFAWRASSATSYSSCGNSRPAASAGASSRGRP